MDGRNISRQVRLQKSMQTLQAQQESGLSIRAYCEENGINEKSFYYRQRQLREAAVELAQKQGSPLAKTGGGEMEVPLHFAQVMMNSPGPAATGTIVVRLGGAQVEVLTGASPAMVSEILRTLREPC